MKNIFAILLALTVLLSCAACGTQSEAPVETTAATEHATEATEPSPKEQTDRDADYIQLSIAEEDGSYIFVTAYDNGEGMAQVEFEAEVKKVATFDLSVLNDIAAQVESSKLKDLNGQNVYEDGMASASMYVSYTDGTSIGAGFSGDIPQEFRDGYAQVESWMRQMMQDVPVYVPRPVVQGTVAEGPLTEMEAILDASGAEPLDMFVITDVPLDESFSSMMGLSKTDGIVNGLNCSPMMSAVAFSCVIATADSEGSVSAIANDFANNIQWNRWVCVNATDAMIATKGNYVLCLVTSGDLYGQISGAATNNGWTVVQTLTN